ncbi:MAG: hypothetical protein K0R46_895 [Herbinix sp.]|nr:hypothetical protein [Herbinix sp.]
MNARFHKLRIWKITVVILLILGLPGVSVSSAEEISSYTIGTGSRAYQYEELLGLYQYSSPAYLKSSVTYQIEALNATLAAESYNSVNREYAEIVVKLSELEGVKGTLQAYAAGITDATALAEINAELMNIDVQINQYSKSISTAQFSLAETKLQEEMAVFYNTYQHMLITNAQTSLKNEFLKKCYGLMLIKEQQDYYQAYQSYLSLVRTVQVIKYQRGLIGRVDLDLAEANLMKNDVTILKNQSNYDKSLSIIIKETNLGSDFNFRFQLPAERKDYKQEELQATFLINNVTLKQLSNYINSYINYQNNNTTKSQALTKQIDLKIQDYSLQENELRNNIKAYAKDAITAYENAFRTYEMARSEIKLKGKQLEIVVAKKAYKKATELELRQAVYEKEAAEVTLYQSYYDIIVWQNILDNHIYGATP